MEEKKTALTDSLVKAAAWIHDTSINKLGYSPLQLVTGKLVTLPGLTTGNTEKESMTDCEAVQRTMENLNKVVTEFREADIKRKLKEYQDLEMLILGWGQQLSCVIEDRLFGCWQMVKSRKLQLVKLNLTS